MNEYLIDLAFSIIFTVLRGSVKNPKSKEQFKRVFLKLRDQINLFYGDDSEFQAEPEEEEIEALKPKVGAKKK